MKRTRTLLLKGTTLGKGRMLRRSQSALGVALVLVLGLYGTGLADGSVGVKHKPGSGFTVSSSDGQFSLKSGGRIQLRHTYESFDNARGEEDVSSFAVQRIRIWMKGKAFQDWKYKFQADFGKGKVNLKDGLIEYSKFKSARITAGQFKVFFDRQQRISSGKQTFADRSIASKAFGISREIGLMVQGDSKDKLFQYNAGVFNGEGAGEKNPNSGHLFLGHVSINPFGAFGLSESDIKKSDKGLLVLDAAVSMNVDRVNKDWDDNDTLNAIDKANVLRYVFGGGYRNRGLYLQGEYFGQTENPKANAVKDVKANGWYAQAGYMVVPGAWEIAARYSIVDPDTDLNDNQKTEAMVGLNHFIGGAGHAMKITADVAQLTEESSSTVEYKDVRVRLQLQIIY